MFRHLGAHGDFRRHQWSDSDGDGEAGVGSTRDGVNDSDGSERQLAADRKSLGEPVASSDALVKLGTDPAMQDGVPELPTIEPVEPVEPLEPVEPVEPVSRWCMQVTQ